MLTFKQYFTETLEEAYAIHKDGTAIHHFKTHVDAIHKLKSLVNDHKEKNKSDSHPYRIVKYRPKKVIKEDILNEFKVGDKVTPARGPGHGSLHTVVRVKTVNGATIVTTTPEKYKKEKLKQSHHAADLIHHPDHKKHS